MHGLTTTQFGRLKRALVGRRRELLALLDGAHGEFDALHANAPEASAHRDEASSNAAYNEVRATLAQHDRQELQEIDQAFVRILQNTYGKCVVCGEPIGYERLMAEPYAARCIACQGEFEHRHTASHG
jgi:DnaK suppressor protein